MLISLDFKTINEICVPPTLGSLLGFRRKLVVSLVKVLLNAFFQGQTSFGIHDHQRVAHLPPFVSPAFLNS